MNQDGIRTRKELVLLWRENIAYPEGTLYFNFKLNYIYFFFV